MKIVTIVGARPQFIKAAAVSRIIQKSTILNEILVHTGQHYDNNMSAIFFEELEIPKPHYNLGICGGSHGKQTGKMISKIEEILLSENPDLVMLYGDTNSTLAGSLAAVKLHITIAHVEAGLRSFNKKMPEEINRILTDHSSDLLFAPTTAAIKNLKNEGIKDEHIFNVGDVMLDSTIYYSQKAECHSTILSALGLKKKNYVLASIHRAENTNNKDKLSNIFNALESIASRQTLVLTLHPRTKKSLESLDFDFQNSDIMFIHPVGFLDMMMLEKNSKIIITDSGGVQKEAYFQKVPCITIRDETEWIELIDHGWNFLANHKTLSEIINRMENIDFPEIDTLYGNGMASGKIVKILEDFHYNKIH